MLGQLRFTTENRVYPPDDVPLLTAAARLPRWDGTGGERLNRFYAAYEKAFFTYCRSVLLPRAQAALEAARESGEALPDWTVELDTTVTREQENMISLYTDTTERCGGRRLLLRRSETWELPGGTLITLGSLFPGETAIRRRLIRTAAEQLRRRQEQGVSLCYPDWQRRLRSDFSLRRFYLTDDALCLYYQMYSIAPAAEGIPVFSVPWDSEHGPRLPAGEALPDLSETPGTRAERHP